MNISDLQAGTKRLITSRHMYWGVAAGAALETTIVPVPFELLMIPVMQANRGRIFLLAFSALAGSLAGALAGYAAGYGIFETLGQWAIANAGDPQAFEQARQAITQQGFWYIVSIGISPVPFQIATLAAGAARYSLPGFVAAAAVSRILRYFGLAVLVWYFGRRARSILEKHKTQIAWICLAAAGLYWGAAILF